MPPYDYITTRMISLERYERELNIQKSKDQIDSSNPNNCPMPLITMKASTNYMADTTMEKLLEKILMLELPKMTNMNPFELLRLPTYEFDMLLVAATRIAKEKDKKLSALANNVDGTLAKYK